MARGSKRGAPASFDDAGSAKTVRYSRPAPSRVTSRAAPSSAPAGGGLVPSSCSSHGRGRGRNCCGSWAAPTPSLVKKHVAKHHEICNQCVQPIIRPEHRHVSMRAHVWCAKKRRVLLRAAKSNPKVIIIFIFH